CHEIEPRRQRDEVRQRGHDVRLDELSVRERAVGEQTERRDHQIEDRVDDPSGGDGGWREIARRGHGAPCLARAIRSRGAAAPGHRHSATYQSRSGWPTVAAAAAPSARKVPNGSAYFMLPRFEMISARPTIVPLNDAIISVISVSFQPTKAPIIASILTS